MQPLKWRLQVWVYALGCCGGRAGGHTSAVRVTPVRQLAVVRRHSSGALLELLLELLQLLLHPHTQHLLPAMLYERGERTEAVSVHEYPYEYPYPETPSEMFHSVLALYSKVLHGIRTSLTASALMSRGSVPDALSGCARSHLETRHRHQKERG
jgi:hypothetical protein